MELRRPINSEAIGRGDRYPEAEVDGSVAFQLWHPQWGGYCAPCVVVFSKSPQDGVGGCFDVYEFHDGEFPTEHNTFRRHYCDADQIVEFGLRIIEMMASCGIRHRCDPWLDRTIKRIEAIKSM
ncbi:MAG: hypothetical protein GY926_19445 [bacterium]|nr:hypothetical protein [bacterium]